MVIVYNKHYKAKSQLFVIYGIIITYSASEIEFFKFKFKCFFFNSFRIDLGTYLFNIINSLIYTDVNQSKY